MKMFLINDSHLLTTTTASINLYFNATLDTNVISSSSSGIILTIIILSFLSISGWIFMSYTLFGRSEAYRTKPDDPFSSTNNSNRANGNDFFISFA